MVICSLPLLYKITFCVRVFINIIIFIYLMRLMTFAIKM